MSNRQITIAVDAMGGENSPFKCLKGIEIFSSKKLDVNAVKQSIKILMLTNFYERPFAPQKGANLRGLLFEPMSSNFASIIHRTIKDLVTSYEPRARIETIVVSPNFDTNSYEVTLTFFVVGITRPQTLTANLKRLR